MIFLKKCQFVFIYAKNGILICSFKNSSLVFSRNKLIIVLRSDSIHTRRIPVFFKLIS